MKFQGSEGGYSNLNLFGGGKGEFKVSTVVMSL